jgi:hypothetical protein
MSDRVSRRQLLGGLGIAAGGSVLAATDSLGSAIAEPGSRDLPAIPVAPRPVAPVNRAVAARHGISYKAMPQQVVGIDVESLITINSIDDIAHKRARLINYIWKGTGLPTGQPSVQRDVSAPVFATLSHLSRIDEPTVPLKYGVSSRVFHLLPQRPWNRRLAVYHNGHGETFDTMLRTVQGLLDQGYSVLACAMPFIHWNVQPIADRKDPKKPITIKLHDDLARWESAGFSTLTFFLEPVTVALNHAIAAYRPTSVQMIGLSGGGWTTTVYAAIDPRITRSYPAAGSLPFYLRPAAPNIGSSLGDWEQRKETLPGFYSAADYLDLYVMGAAGPGRRQLQILNRFDACCFSGVGHRSYGPAVSHRVDVIGNGRWDLLEDATHDQHIISPYALSVILWDLKVNRDNR